MAIVIEDDVSEPALFVALTTNEYEPAVVGVPDNTPETLFNVRPAGTHPNQSTTTEPAPPTP